MQRDDPDYAALISGGASRTLTLSDDGGGDILRIGRGKGDESNFILPSSIVPSDAASIQALGGLPPASPMALFETAGPNAPTAEAPVSIVLAAHQDIIRGSLACVRFAAKIVLLGSAPPPLRSATAALRI